MADDAAAKTGASYGMEAALRAEYNAIWNEQVPRPPNEDTDDQAQDTRHLPRVLVHTEMQSALCLSGGGIRSAAVCLGVVQELARKGALAEFDYLSTVSGGGYIGGWLQALLARLGGSASSLQRLLSAGEAPAALSNLRNYTSYLIPQGGLMALDSWAAAVVVGRNILINWLILLPTLMAFTLLPQGAVALLVEFTRQSHVAEGAQTLSLLLLSVASIAVCLQLPSHYGESNGGKLVPTRWITALAVLPALAWAMLVLVAAVPSLALPGSVIAPSMLGRQFGFAGATSHVNGIVLDTFIVLVAGYCIAALVTWVQRSGAVLFLKNSYAWLLASLVGCAGLLLGLRLAEGQPAWLLVILGPLWAIGTHLALSPIFVMLRWRAYRGDQDREWLARLSAAKLRVVLGWAVFAAICLLPLDAHVRAVVGGAFGDSAAHKAITGAITLASGLFAALFGKSDTPLVRSGKKPGVFSIATATTLATAIFALGLLALLSWGGEALARAMPDGVPIWARPFALAAALFLGSRLADIPVNVNRFSLHGMYRNRLERAFLGSVRPTQGEGARGDADHAGTRDPFTDFDPLDNIAMADLRPAEPARWKLFPVVNVALNLTNAETTRRAWAERKAGPFSITPLACGSDSLPRGKGFVDSLHFGSQENEQGAHAAKRGFSLASAITISGAAASPNMGYHSSSATAFLMTLFNVRLGAWLANPAVSSRNKLARSVSTQRALFSELLGLSDGTSPAIYLSDGGHFDNLGLYAMVRRGCRRIVVIDAAADPECAFEDLGNAVRKIEIDLAVSIDFGVMPMAGRADWKDGNRAWAVAKITWNAFPQAAPGKLLYIKASLPPGVPADVLATAREDAAFPHDSTANQFFTESKFESYRKLGRFLVGQLPGTATGLDALFEGLVDEEARIAQSLEQQ